MKISTMITAVEGFSSELYSSNKIGIEIQTFPQHILDSNIEPLIECWKSKLKDYKEPIAIHGSAYDLNPGSTDRRIVEITKHRYKQSLEIGESLGAKYVVFHSQVNPLLSVSRIRQMKVSSQIEFWNDMFNESIPENMNILLENEYDDTCEDIRKIVEGVNHPNFGVCLDIGHVLAYSKVSLEEWFKELHQHIKYIHMHWNDGNSDQHRAPSDCEIIKLANLLREYEINPIITLEYSTENIIEEIQRVKKYLNRK